VLLETVPAELDVDAARTTRLRDELRARRGGSPLPMINRGEGYERMLQKEK
jgi:hypothetical protein